MQFNFKRPSRIHKLNVTGERDPSLYQHSLQFFNYVPELTITLEEFERLALERLQVLRIIERFGAKYNKNSKDYRDGITAEIKKQNLPSNYYKITFDDSTVSDRIYDERKNDHISHFILRLAYCKSESLRNWFIAQEVDLFRFRFSAETSESRKRFMELNSLDYEPISAEEKREIFSKLVSTLFNNSSSQVETSSYYKVCFTEVVDLVSSRKVYLQDGYAYIPEQHLVSLVVSAFRSHLSLALALTSRVLPQLEEEGRLLNILNTLHARYIGTDYSKKKQHFTEEVAPEMLDELSKTSFPLCMRALHESLRTTHHLKYFGRLQYGLFLKGIGLSLQDSLRFWREEFSKTMDMDKFDKQYAYNIRYNYGKEGKRADFTPYSCSKIIMTNPPGPGDCHGCPFKHSDQGNLRQRLANLHVGNTDNTNIVDLSSKGHYQLACTRYFEVTHGEATVDQAISHPNQYFEESKKIRKGVHAKSAGQVSTQRSVVFEASASQAASSQNAQDFDMDIDDMEDFSKDIADIEDFMKGH